MGYSEKWHSRTNKISVQRTEVYRGMSLARYSIPGSRMGSKKEEPHHMVMRTHRHFLSRVRE